LLEGYPKVDGFFSLYFPSERDIHFNLYVGTNSIQTNLANFLSVCQITDDARRFEWLAQTNFLPWLTGGQQPLFVSPTNSLKAVLDFVWDPQRVVFLPDEAREVIQGTNQTRIRILRQSMRAHQITAEIEAEQPAMVVLAQSYYHWWRAFVDQKPVKIWRANHAFQAIEVPEGQHEVTFKYRDDSFRIGAVISLLSLAVCGVLAWSQRKKA
jgi:hypothetical protein